jgi:ParB-like partition proteins
MNTSKIVSIPVKQIFPHPKNPRRDIGDIAELADSIRQSGVLQNLTVVRHHTTEDGEQVTKFRVVIGHRRLAACIEAGVEEVPCAIADWSEEEQLAVMLSENMQRADLTMTEQAHGIQMMFDLGKTEDDVQKLTGLSKSTIRSRKKLLEFDDGVVDKGFEKGATLADFLELAKIEDEKTRADVANSLGTGNFNYNLKRALDGQKRIKGEAECIAYLETFAEKVEGPKSLKYLWNGSDLAKLKDVIANSAAEKFYYKQESYGLCVRIDFPENEDEPVKTQEQIEREQKELLARDCKNKLRECEETARELRDKFVDEFKHKYKYAVDALKKLYPLAVDEYNSDYSDYQGAYEENPDLDDIYAVLVGFGYVISDTERSLMDGTCEYYTKDEE